MHCTSPLECKTINKLQGSKWGNQKYDEYNSYEQTSNAAKNRDGLDYCKTWGHGYTKYNITTKKN